jgi:hypothetical protein
MLELLALEIAPDAARQARAGVNMCDLTTYLTI